MPIVRRQTE